MILKCNCKHAFQDKEYGQGLRLHNIMKGNKKARCTVCGTVREVRGMKGGKENK